MKIDRVEVQQQLSLPVEMDLNEFSRIYFYIFYIGGHSAINPRKQICSQRRKLSFKKKFTFPMAVLSLIILAITVSGLVIQNQVTPKDVNLVNFFFGNIFLLVISITNYCIILQNALYRSNLKTIYDKFTVVEQIFWAQLRQRLSFNDLAKELRLKMFTCIALFLLALGAMIVINSHQSGHLHVAVNVFALLFFSITALLHALVYIDLEYYLIKSFVKNVQLAGKSRIARVLYGKPEDSDTIIALLGYYKHVHFKLWDIAQAIGTHFGWILLCICMQNFVDIAYSTYWIYRLIRNEIDISLLRKYIFQFV